MFLLIALLLNQCHCTLKYGENPYEILGVSRTASKEEIKRTYRQIARKYHPDVAKINKKEAERIFIRATDAYEILINETRRTAYDETGDVSEDLQFSRTHHKTSQEEPDFEDIFRQYYEYQRKQQQQRQQQRSYSYHYSHSYSNSNSNINSNSDSYSNSNSNNFKTYKISGKFKSMFSKFRQNMNI